MGSALSACRCFEVEPFVDHISEVCPARDKAENGPQRGRNDRQGSDNAVDRSQVIYEGAYKDGKRHGFGVLLRPCGSRFEGFFLNDAANGFGKFVHPS
ncbi:MORN repeat-containing protein, partial [Toxoplasma gondii TgCatPRC2]